MAHRDSHWTVATRITDAMAKGDSRKFVAVNSGNERPAGVMPATVEMAGVVALNDSLNDGLKRNALF